MAASTALQLPLRLIPRRGRQLYLLLFNLVFTGFVVFWIVTAVNNLWSVPAADLPSAWFRFLFPAVGFVLLLVGLWSLFKATVKLLPGSPAFHLILSSDGIAMVSPFRRQRIAWTEVAPFAIAPRTQRGRNSVQTIHWVVALKRGDESHLATPRQRYKHAVLRIDPAEYAGGNAAAAAEELRLWLDRLRQDAASPRLKSGHEIDIPSSFLGVVVPEAAAGRAPSARPQSRTPTVVKRR